jgi:hypothetical protein
MIKVIQNPNLKEWFKVIGIDIVDEVRGQALAMRKAKRVAKQNGFNQISIEMENEKRVLTISNT